MFAATTDTDLTDRLLAIFEAPDYRPPVLPAVALELLELSLQPDVRIDAMVGLLERDPVLAGRVLKLVRSPFYAGKAPIRSLKQAVVRIGLRTLRDVVLEVALHMRVFRAEGYTERLEQVRDHCTTTAWASRLLANKAGIDGDFAFLCGLLHDIGVAGILLALADGAGSRAPPDLVPLWPAIDAVHERATGIMARLWQLPDEVQQVVAHHHEVPTDPRTALLIVADHLAARVGAPLHDELRFDGTDAEALKAALLLLRMDESRLVGIADELCAIREHGGQGAA